MITQKELKELVTYNKLTGKFTSNKTGRIATYVERKKTGGGRVRFQLDELKNLYASRLAVLYVTGKYPDGFVKCVNGDSTDLRWKNLRFKLQESIDRVDDALTYHNQPPMFLSPRFIPNVTLISPETEPTLLQRFWRWLNG